MGYSIMTEFPTVATRDAVLEFLSEHLTPIHELVGEETPYVRGPVVDPSYDRDDAADRLIGFDFSGSHAVQSRVAYLLCYWMAKRVPGSLVWYDGLDPVEPPAETDDDGFHPLERLERLQADRLGKFPSWMQEDMDRIAALGPPVKSALSRLTALMTRLSIP